MLRFKLIALGLMCFSINAFASDKLIFSIDLIRHGDRTPVSVLPHPNVQWQLKPGELTPKGQQQEFQLGKQLRNEYVYQFHLLPLNYVPETLYVRSTDFERTIESAKAFLLGLYPLSKRNDLVIPIHTMPIASDHLLSVRPKANVFAQIRIYLAMRKLWMIRTSQLKDKLTYWSKQTGLPLSNFKEVEHLADNLKIEEFNHQPLPKGISNDDANQIIKLGEYGVTERFKLADVTGPMSDEFIKTVNLYFYDAITNTTKLRYVLLSGHDSSIMAVMNALQAPVDSIPPYASRVNFSLWQHQGKFLIKVSYNNKLIRITPCNDNDCSL